MNGLFMTVEGVVGSDLRKKEFSGTPFVSFRLVAKERRYDRMTQSWQTSHSSWMTVSCFRGLAVNVAQSIGKGDLVLVHGKARVTEYRGEDGVVRVNLDLDASSIGHDLKFGTTRFRPATQEHDDERLREHAEAFNREQLNQPGESYDALVAHGMRRAVAAAARDVSEAALEGVDPATGELLEDVLDELDDELDDELVEPDDEDREGDEDDDDAHPRTPVRELAGVGKR